MALAILIWKGCIKTSQRVNFNRVKESGVLYERSLVKLAGSALQNESEEGDCFHKNSEKINVRDEESLLKPKQSG